MKEIADFWVFLVEKCRNTNQFQVSIAKQPQFQREFQREGLAVLGVFFCRSCECFVGLGLEDFTNIPLHKGGGYFCVTMHPSFCFNIVSSK